MSYRVDPKTLLFDDLTAQESRALLDEVEKLIMIGTGVWETEGFKSWLKAVGYDERQALLVMATAYPQRALLSLLNQKVY